MSPNTTPNRDANLDPGELPLAQPPNVGVCAALGESIGAFVDGELPALKRTQVEDHMVRCKACEQLAVEIRQLDLLAAKERVPEVSATEWRRLWQSINVPAIRRVELAGPPASSAQLWRWLAPAIAAAALVLAGVGIGLSWRDGAGSASGPISKPPPSIAPSGEYAESVSGPKPVFSVGEEVPSIDYDPPEPQRP